jgi:hypothetical protein
VNVRGSHVVLAVAAAGLVGFGVWLGRSSSSAKAEPTARPASQATEAVAVAVEPAPRARTPQPVLARSRPAPPGLAADLAAADPKIRRAAVRELAQSDDADPAALLAASRDGDL